MSVKDSLRYIDKSIGIYLFKIMEFFNSRLMQTYPSNYQCGRCEDCGRTVHDFTVPDDLWIKVYGSEHGILCYDCFCEKARDKGIYKWMKVVEWIT